MLNNLKDDLRFYKSKPDVDWVLSKTYPLNNVIQNMNSTLRSDVFSRLSRRSRQAAPLVSSLEMRLWLYVDALRRILCALADLNRQSLLAMDEIVVMHAFVFTLMILASAKAQGKQS